MKIYVLNTNELFEKLKDFNGFTLSELNDLKELLKEIIKLLKKAKLKNMVYTVHNFVLDFNLEDKLTDNKKYCLFYPDDKFKKQLEKHNL